MNEADQRSPLEKVRDEFAALIDRDPEALVSSYLYLFGPVVSPRLACELSANYRQSDATRGVYRLSVMPTARRITRLAWSSLLSRTSSPLPVVIIVGGGPGSGKLMAAVEATPLLGKEASIIYDASGDSFDEIRNLVRDAHAKTLPVIAAYVLRPLQPAAGAYIAKALREGQPPDPHQFAEEHARCAENLRLLLSAFAGHKLFAATAVINGGGPGEIVTADSGSIDSSACTERDALEAFRLAMEDLEASSSVRAPGGAYATRDSRLKAPSRGKSLQKQAARIGYLLALNLRRQLVENRLYHDPNQPSLLALLDAKPETMPPIRVLAAPPPPAEKGESRHEAVTASLPAKEVPTQPGDPPVMELIHRHTHGTRQEVEKATNVYEQTFEGQREMEEEQPERLVARQRVGEPHTVEMVRVR